MEIFNFLSTVSPLLPKTLVCSTSIVLNPKVCADFFSKLVYYSILTDTETLSIDLCLLLRAFGPSGPIKTWQPILNQHRILDLICLVFIGKKHVEVGSELRLHVSIRIGGYSENTLLEKNHLGKNSNGNFATWIWRVQGKDEITFFFRCHCSMLTIIVLLQATAAAPRRAARRRSPTPRSTPCTWCWIRTCGPSRRTSATRSPSAYSTSTSSWPRSILRYRITSF